MRDFFHNYDPVNFVSHIDGDFVNGFDGRAEGDALYICAKVKAADNAVISINGIPAVFDSRDSTYYAEVPLYTYRNTLCAIDSKNGYRAEIVVYKVPDAVNKFYFTVDDAILFLYELTKTPEKYPSMFLHPFLEPFKQAHDLFGAHVHLNLYYEFNSDSAADFAEHKEYFNLSMMTDRYRKEWEENSNWLTLSCHAHANYPDKPNQVLPPDFIADTIRKAHKEILRFAGPKSLVPVTTMHWGNGYVEALRAFRENGYRIQCASFRMENNDEAYISYYGRDGLPAYIRGRGLDAYARQSDSQPDALGRDVWKDNREDIIFSHTDMVLNVTDAIPTDTIPQWIDAYLAQHSNKGIFSMIIHEEYYYPDYIAYIPDCGERVLSAIRHVYEKGFRGAALEKLLLEREMA